jgi:Trk-type K+ transport system membrane component
VYEERALGIDDDDEHSEKRGLQHVRKEGSYVHEHLQQQLAYDAWWLVLCTFISESPSFVSSPLTVADVRVVCIADRGKLTDSSRLGWFTVFGVLFEVSSAYANVGFSLGVPYVSRSC